MLPFLVYHTRGRSLLDRPTPSNLEERNEKGSGNNQGEIIPRSEKIGKGFFTFRDEKARRSRNPSSSAFEPPTRAGTRGISECGVVVGFVIRTMKTSTSVGGDRWSGITCFFPATRDEGKSMRLCGTHVNLQWHSILRRLVARSRRKSPTPATNQNSWDRWMGILSKSTCTWHPSPVGSTWRTDRKTTSRIGDPLIDPMAETSYESGASFETEDPESRKRTEHRWPGSYRGWVGILSN